MLPVKISRCTQLALPIGVGILAFAVAACGSSTKTSSANPTTETTSIAAACPTAAADASATPDWTFSGSNGSIAVIGPTADAGPKVTVDGPFSVTETTVHTVSAGDGPTVGETATVSVCYMGVNGRNGNVFDSSYQRGAPAAFQLNQVVPGFQKAIAGQKVGSTVAVAMTPDDGYPAGQPSAGIEPGDTLIFAIKILDASN